MEKVLERIPGIDYADLDKVPSTIGVKTLFDTGSDGGAMTSSLYENHDITNLDNKIIKLTTVNGIQRKLFERGKVKLQTNRFN